MVGTIADICFFGACLKGSVLADTEKEVYVGCALYNF
jgi:hypothetical protein